MSRDQFIFRFCDFSTKLGWSGPSNTFSNGYGLTCSRYFEEKRQHSHMHCDKYVVIIIISRNNDKLNIDLEMNYFKW